MSQGKQGDFKQLLRELTEVAGPPGHEGPVRELMGSWARGAADEVTSDRLGAMIARKGETGPRVMVAGHLDEVGFMVTRITEEGFLRFQPLGGWWSQVVSAQRVEVVTDKGPLVGVIGSKPPHLLSPEQRKKAVPMDELFIDVGAEDREDAEQMGIQPGDVVVPYSPFTEMANPKHWLAKGMDNRMGCAVAVEVLRRLRDVDHPNTVYGVGTVMEEVGRRGAFTATAAVQPDIGFAVDVGIAGDTPGGNKDQAPGRLGEGPQLVLYDAGHIPHRGLARLIQDTAADEGIPLQHEWIARGATDASHIHLYDQGVPTVSVGVPARYIHSHTSIIHQDDVEGLVNLLVAVIRRLDQEKVDELVRG
ncbi:MAG: M42 family metallopeptidase [Firmicutes bacterium]|uniref:Endoglucanase n=1 Tax=Melghirimyces thermohalophilus TaxID=1236220 RepID=A0A1G6MQR9_9BACL|nr:M42 family metallopeptidase [Melghirimyces thermohalophilus]MDA8354547.1 M42 family metallopeptidase [Bacillota bacterium]SDC57852.1 endoglucanase [Melghirimyces thermohalophilus]